jgi:tRNA (guanine37-N1)-methyltransferase
MPNQSEAYRKSGNDETSSIVAQASKDRSNPLIPVPVDPTHVYPVTSFPSLSVFEISLKHPALVVPARRTADIRRELKHAILYRPKLKCVYPLLDLDQTPSDDNPRTSYRKIVLVNRPDIYEDQVLKDLLESSECCKEDHLITVGYADWTVDEVLKQLLPVEEVPSAFEIIGHLAHINLREELLPYKYLIGKVLLDKNAPRIKTVVNKIGSIDTEYRTFGMEVIAGNQEEGWSRVCLKEEGCQYELDFRQVYWNSRLGGEHRRLVDIIHQDAKAKKKEQDQTLVVADLMAGIGPFAIPLTCKGKGENEVKVYANDLNPASYEYLEINAKKNKCENLQCYNMDARAFCHHLLDKGIEFNHVIMNLPATAPEFLDAFRGFAGKTLPRIHVHCFGPKESQRSEQEAVERCVAALGCALDLEEHEVSVHLVRDVAPKKNMYCVSFNLPKSVCDLPRIDLEHTITEPSGEPDTKRTKLL